MGTARFRAHVALLRGALGPPGAAAFNVCRAPVKTLAILYAYARRLLGFAGRQVPILWRILRRDKEFMAAARREARFGEYLGWR